jgi:hyperosmotically inducible protein
MKIQSSLALSLALVCLALGACAASGSHRSTGQMVDDTTIAARTKTALLADSTTDGLNIDVEVDRDKVQLNGFVDSQAQVNRAGEIARSISGVASVENNLQVSEGGSRRTGEYFDDKVLSSNVKAALANDALAPASEIDVEVNRGIVSLGGFVDSSAERDAAAAAAKGVKGVQKVNNNLEVRAKG